MLNKISVILIEPFGLFREGLCRILADEQCDLVWCNDLPPREAIPALSNSVAVICIMGGDFDVAMSNFLELKKFHPNGRGVLLLDRMTPQQLTIAVVNGVVAVILKQSSLYNLVVSLKLVFEATVVFPASLVSGLIEDLTSVGSGPPTMMPMLIEAPTPGLNERPIPRFSAREQTVLDYLTQGLSNKEIARALLISDATVKVHVKALLRKSRTRNRTEVATYALRGVAKVTGTFLPVHG